MEIAMVAAKFTADEANRLRKAMATFRRNGTIGTASLKDRFIEGMVGNGYQRDFAERCFNQIKGFGDYGFPESHAASFALLVYASAWIKCHYPAVFACAILNSQPMGFYAPAQLVRDAKDHGIEVRPVDVMHSDWDCTLEPDGNGGFALRLGFRQIKGFQRKSRCRRPIVAARQRRDFTTMRSLWLGAGLNTRALETLAKGDAWRSLKLDRRGALWAAKGLGDAPLPLFAGLEAETEEPDVKFPPLSVGEDVGGDYRHLRLSLKQHPVALLRDRLGKAQGIVPNEAQLSKTRSGRRVEVAGLVLNRQQPGTASGVIFMTIEDETGIANIVVWPRVFERFRRPLLGSRLLAVEGKVERDESGFVIHVIADRLTDLSRDLGRLGAPPSPYDASVSLADEVRHPGFDRRGPPGNGVIPASRDFR